MSETWPNPIKSTHHVSQAIDWVRHRTGDRTRLIVAIGATGLAVSKPRDMDAEDAIAVLADLQDAIAQAVRQLDQSKQTHTAIALKDR